MKRIFIFCLGLLFVVAVWGQMPQIRPLQLDSLPQQWADSGQFEQPLPSKDAWWQQFNDTMLLHLIDLAVANNADVVTAINNIELARNQYRNAVADFFPTVDMQASYSPTRQSMAVYGNNDISRYGNASINASWEIDIFGTIRKEAEYYKKNYLATREQYHAVMVSLCSQVGIAYINLRVYQTQKDVTYTNLETQKATLDITEARYRAGLASQLDVAQAKTVYYSTLASIPSIESAILQQINQIGLLVGDIPWELRDKLIVPQPIPRFTPKLNLEIPAKVIRQRPDIRVAELNMEAQANKLQLSRREWFPQFMINGSIGFESNEFKNFFKQENMTWSVSPAMKWNLFSGMKRYYGTQSEQINYNEAVEKYNTAIHNALLEVDNALIMYQKALIQITTNEQAFEQAKLSLELSLDLYMKGLQSFQTVVDSQRNVLSYENNVATTQGNIITYFIQLYQALGGGYPTNE
jgi:NodT family efflux transporter outer membrane factor (OMF) lipoprotein